MNDFVGMEDLLSDFLLEAGDMLSEVNDKIMDLENHVQDKELLNEIYRGFHTIKGGAGFLKAGELVQLCNIIENLFDKLRNDEMELTPELMVMIFSATAEVRTMFGALQQNLQPNGAPADLIEALEVSLSGNKKAHEVLFQTPIEDNVEPKGADALESTDWDQIFASLTSSDSTDDSAMVQSDELVSIVDPKQFDKEEPKVIPEDGRGARLTEGQPNEILEMPQLAIESGLHVDPVCIDRVAHLSDEINEVQGRLSTLRNIIIQGRIEAETLHELDAAINELDTLAANLQIAVAKTRIQTIGRLFTQCAIAAHDWGKSIGFDVELVISGEDTQAEVIVIEALREPLLCLLRNLVIHHGEAISEQEIVSGALNRCLVELNASHRAGRTLITLTGKDNGLHPDAVRALAIQKGIVGRGAVGAMDDTRSLELIFAPNWGVGMHEAKTSIDELGGEIDISFEPGIGSVTTISLPIGSAVVRVLVLRQGVQAFALPLSMIRGIISLTHESLQQISDQSTMLVGGEPLKVLQLSELIGWEQGGSQEVAVLVHLDEMDFILTADALIGQFDMKLKPLESFRPKGVSAAAITAESEIVLILDVKELLDEANLH